MKKYFKIIILTLLFIAMFIGNVCAADSCKVTLSADKTNLKKGETTKIKINLSNITNIDDGIIQIIGQLEFDQDLFEIVYVNDPDIEEELDLDTIKDEYDFDDLKIAYYNEDDWCLLVGEVEDANGLILIGETIGDPVKSSQTIGSIQFKVKKDASSTESITLSSLSVIDPSFDDYEIEAEPTAKIKISSVGTEEPEEPEEPQQPAKNNTKNENTSANEAAPYTGAKEVSPLIFAVAVIAIMGFAGVIRYRGIK